MSELTKKWMQGKGRPEQPPKKHLPQQEQLALEKIRTEAKQHRVTLQSDGEGGLPPSLVLGVLRRDRFSCSACSGRRDLTMHHKGGIPESKWLSKKGHHNDRNNIVTLCAACHDKMHTDARKKGTDSTQVTPVGDVGTKRDKGKPVAKPTS